MKIEDWKEQYTIKGELGRTAHKFITTQFVDHEIDIADFIRDYATDAYSYDMDYVSHGAIFYDKENNFFIYIYQNNDNNSTKIGTRSDAIMLDHHTIISIQKDYTEYSRTYTSSNSYEDDCILHTGHYSSNVENLDIYDYCGI